MCTCKSRSKHAGKLCTPRYRSVPHFLSFTFLSLFVIDSTLTSNSFFAFLLAFAMMSVQAASASELTHFFLHSYASFLARDPPQFLDLIVLLGHLFPLRLHKSGTNAPSCSFMLVFFYFYTSLFYFSAPNIFLQNY